MARPIIERMRVIVSIDERITKVQEGFVTLAECFASAVENPASSVNFEEFNAGLDGIVKTTTELLLMVPAATLQTAEATEETTRRRRGRLPQKYDLDGEWLTFNEIVARFPSLNENTLRNRLSPNSGYTVHEAVHGRASVPAPDSNGAGASA